MKSWIALVLMAVAAPASAALFVNEIDADQTGVDTEEFVEIYNSGPGAVDFGSTPHVLVFFNGNGDTSYRAIDLSGTLAALDYYVVGSSDVANVDLDFCPSLGAGCDNQLQNGADGVALYTGTSAAFPGGSMATTTDLVDAIVYSTDDPDDAELLAALGETVQYNENAFGTKDTTSISRTPDGAVFNAGQTPSPGIGNGLAPPVVVTKTTTMAANASNVAVDLCAVDGMGATTFNVASLPANGSLSDNSGAFAGPRAVVGTLRYTPNPAYSGLDTFDVTATDTQPATSDPVTYEMAVQQGGVVISEIMQSPSGDDRQYEWVEIYNLTGSAVSLTRLDTSRRITVDTTGNLTGMSIAAGASMIIAADVTTLGLDNGDILCEWDLFETDVIRIPYPQFETMFASPDAADCTVSDGSRLLLFGVGDVLLDAVDTGLVGAQSGDCTGTSYVFDTFFPGDIDEILNDESLDWFCSSEPGIPGNLSTRPGTSGDIASPLYVPSKLESPTYAESCFGACCLTDGGCLEGATEQECIDATCQFGSDAQGRFQAGDFCSGASCPAAEPQAKCCLPIGVCENLDECSCLQLGGDFNDAANCDFPGQSTGECPVEVAILLNELDYDTPGSDADEFIELKGTPGGPLAGWTVELHNGNANTTGDTLYQTFDLATAPGGVVPGDGYFVIGSPTVANVDLLFANATNQIQNGGGCGANGCGDGIVLLFAGTVVEGNSYDTTTAGFTARGGGADGVFLPDLGAVDNAIGSLQRLPDGGVWSTTNNTTPGVGNFDGGDVGACCFDEVCEGFQFEADCTSNGGEYLGDGTTCDDNPCIPRGACCLPDGSCRDSLTLSECGILGGNWNGDGTACPDWAAFEACLAGPAGALGAGCEVWNLDGDAPADVDLADAALFQLSLCDPAPTGACCQLDGNCDEISQFACDLGGGDYRGDGIACAGLDPACDPATVGDILINEVWADDPGTDDHEFIEFFGMPGATLNGRSLIVVDGDTEGDPAATAFRSVTLQIDFTAGDVLDGSGFFTLGTGPGLVGMVDDSLDARGNSDGMVNEFQNGSQTYALVPTADIVYCTSTGIPDATCNDNVAQLTDGSYAALTASAYDAVATIDSDFDDFYFFAPVVRDSGFTFDYAQRIPNGTDTNTTADWETVFGNELGDPADPSSPGDVNASQSTLLGACCDGTTCNQKSENTCAGPGEEFLGAGTACTPNPCECITIAEAKLLGNNVAVTLCDVVISSTVDLIDFAGLANFFVQDATGAVTVFGDPAADIDPILAIVSEGYQIDINGTTDSFNGLFELGSPLNLLSDDGFVGIPTPTPVAVADFQDDSLTAETLESRLVELGCVEFAAAGGTFNGAANYTVTPVPASGTDTVTVRVSTQVLDLVGTTIPTGPVSVIGIFSQFDTTDPRTGGYQLLVRSTGDLIQPCP